MGMAYAAAMRRGLRESPRGVSIVGTSFGDEAVGLDRKTCLKKHSACHLVTWVKLTQTSIRPGLRSAGSRRSTSLAVKKISLSKDDKND